MDPTQNAREAFLADLRLRIGSTSPYLTLRKPRGFYAMARDFHPGRHLTARLDRIDDWNVRPEAVAVIGGLPMDEAKALAAHAVAQPSVMQHGFRAIPKDTRWNVVKIGPRFDLRDPESRESALTWLVASMKEADEVVRPHLS